MMFSTKAEYGVRVMVALARRAGANAAALPGDGALDPVVPLAEIAEHDGLPLAYLEHLVARLRKAGLVDSRRGAAAGTCWRGRQARSRWRRWWRRWRGSIAPIECISLGADGTVKCSRESDPGHVCPTKLLWSRVRGSIVSTLRETTLADLVASAAPHSRSPPPHCKRETLTTGA